MIGIYIIIIGDKLSKFKKEKKHRGAMRMLK